MFFIKEEIFIDLPFINLIFEYRKEHSITGIN